MQAVYALFIGNQSLEHVLQTNVKPEFLDDAFGRDFAERLFLRTVDQRVRTDEIIQKHIANWEIDRLAMVDRIILQMAITELLTFEDIPTKVTINEAIEIAKKFSTARSGRFVNGILDAAVLSLQKSGELKKEGRGLVDLPARQKRGDNDKREDSVLPGEDVDAPRESEGPVQPLSLKPVANTEDGEKRSQKKRRIKRPGKKKDS